MIPCHVSLNVFSPRVPKLSPRRHLFLLLHCCNCRLTDTYRALTLEANCPLPQDCQACVMLPALGTNQPKVCITAIMLTETMFVPGQDIETVSKRQIPRFRLQCRAQAMQLLSTFESQQQMLPGK